MPTRSSPREAAHQLQRLPAREPARHRRAGPGREGRIEPVDVEREIDRRVARPRADHLERRRDAVAVQPGRGQDLEPHRTRRGRCGSRPGSSGPDRPAPRGSPGPSSCRGRSGPGRPARGRRGHRPAPAPAARTSRRARASSGQAMKWSPPSARSFAPEAITSAAAASIAGATARRMVRVEHGVAAVDHRQRLHQVEPPGKGLELGELHRGRADRPRPEPAAGPVGHRGVVGKAHHRDVDAREVAGVAPAQEGERPAVGHLGPMLARARRRGTPIAGASHRRARSAAAARRRRRPRARRSR